MNKLANTYNQVLWVLVATIVVSITVNVLSLHGTIFKSALAFQKIINVYFFGGPLSKMIAIDELHSSKV
jgi:hypothetical protein